MIRKESETIFPLIFGFGRVIRSRMREGAPDCPSLPQLEVLDFLAERGDATMHELALFLKIKAPSATSLVGELARAGLLKRSRNPRDRRQVHIAITPKGAALLKRVVERRKKVIASVLSPLGLRDIEELNRLLKKIIIEIA